MSTLAVQVEDAVPGGGISNGTYGSSPTSIVEVSGTTYFVATDSVNGTELWRINRSGIAELVEDTVQGGGIAAGLATSDPKYLTNVNGTLYFSADNRGTNNPNLWRVNGAGVAEFVPNTFDGGITSESQAQARGATLLTVVNGTLYFKANSVSAGAELWRVNRFGVAEIVEDSIPDGGINPTISSDPRYLNNVNGTLYFRANDGTNGYELWRVNSSGTAEMVEDSVAGGGIRPGGTSSSPTNFTNVNGTLYFQANDGTIPRPA